MKFPSFVKKDRDFQQLMTLMLTKNSLSRLCKLSHIKATAYFAGFNWDSLLSLNITPPFLPKLTSSDTSAKAIPYVHYIKVNCF